MDNAGIAECGVRKGNASKTFPLQTAHPEITAR
jgi:hypothetical protein